MGIISWLFHRKEKNQIINFLLFLIIEKNEKKLKREEKVEFDSVKPKTVSPHSLGFCGAGHRSHTHSRRLKHISSPVRINLILQTYSLQFLCIFSFCLYQFDFALSFLLYPSLHVFSLGPII